LAGGGEGKSGGEVLGDLGRGVHVFPRGRARFGGKWSKRVSSLSSGKKGQKGSGHRSQSLLSRAIDGTRGRWLWAIAERSKNIIAGEPLLGFCLGAGRIRSEVEGLT